MLISNELDLNTVCRTCLSIGEMKSIYETSATELCFADMLMVCTSVEYYPETDNLPAQICHDCITEINRCYKFAIKCRKSEDELQNYLRNILIPEASFFKNDVEHTQHLTEENKHIEVDYRLSESHSETMPTIRIRNDLNGPISTDQGGMKSQLSTKISNETITSLDNRAFIWLKNEINHEPIVNDISTLKFNIKVENDSEIEDSTQDILGTIFEEIETSQRNNAESLNDPSNTEDCRSTTTECENEEANDCKTFRSEDKHIYRLRKKNTFLQSYSEYYRQSESSSDPQCNEDSSSEDESEQLNCIDNNKLYSCTLCNRSYKLEKKMIIHAKQHTEELVACQICGEMFAFGSTLKFHMATHAKEDTMKVDEALHRKHKCQVCDYPFHEAKDLKEHMKVHTDGESPFSCSFCGQTFAELKRLKLHMQAHDGEKSYSCSKSECKFANKTYLTSHKQVHITEIKRQKCEVCDHPFRKSANLKAHMVIHTNTRPHPCSICGKSYLTKYKLEVHKRTHTKERPFSCAICNRSFSSKSQLTLHKSTHSGQSFICSVCGKNFTVYDHLRNHLLIHTDERNHTCTICDHAYKTKKSLYKHTQNKHPKGDPVTCTICNRSFINKERLQRHIHIHNEEKPFHCSVCNKSFRGKASLKQHMPAHSNERTHCCTICDKAFKFTSNLNLHMRTHKDERPFACTFCDLTFKLQHHLKAHLKSKHPSKD